MIKNQLTSPLAIAVMMMLSLTHFINPRATGQELQELKEQKPFPYSLVGIIISENGSSHAVLKKDHSDETLFLTIRDTIDGSQILKIFEDRIILQRADSTFQIFLEAKDKKKQTLKSSLSPEMKASAWEDRDSEENNPALQVPLIREMTWPEIKEIIETDLPLLIRESRVIPYIVQGKFQGFKVTRLPKTRFLSDGEIQVNDVIRFINDVELDGFAPLLSLERRLKNERRLSIILERNGRRLQRTWKFRNLAIPEHGKPIR